MRPRASRAVSRFSPKIPAVRRAAAMRPRHSRAVSRFSPKRAAAQPKAPGSSFSSRGR